MSFVSIEPIVEIFNSLFSESENTRIQCGGQEPLYRPKSDEHAFNVIISNQDFVASALHEISHWCIAGEARRQLEDYGYWYVPDGRTDDQQQKFEQVEIKPQALEWLFSVACGHVFKLSADNLNNPDVGVSDCFKENIVQQVHEYLHKGLPARANLFFDALRKKFKLECIATNPDCYSLSHLN